MKVTHKESRLIVGTTLELDGPERRMLAQMLLHPSVVKAFREFRDHNHLRHEIIIACEDTVETANATIEAAAEEDVVPGVGEIADAL
jgi:hypothetical protein